MTYESKLTNLTGLTQAEAAQRLRKVGYNELPAGEKRTLLAVIFDIVREPMFLLLIACGTLYLLLGDLAEALMLLGFVFVVIGITLYQERKTDRALEALRDLSSPRALVIRGGDKIRIAGREVAPGDVILLSEGDRVPADAIIRECVNLSADESLLTGESVPVVKTSSQDAGDWKAPGGDNLPFLYSGTMIVRGQGIAIVHATGSETQIGKIGKALQQLKPEQTPLQKKTGRLVKTFALVGAFLCTVVAIGYAFVQGSWLEGLLAGLTLGMAILPEEFPVVLTIFLALGAWRISQRRVLTRRAPAVETLGSATVICTDKTGTLTLNEMTVTDTYTNGSLFRIDDGDGQIPEEVRTLIRFSVLSSQSNPFDPMEKAMRMVGEKVFKGTEAVSPAWELQKEYPLSPELLSMSRVWHAPEESKLIVAAKGAPEAIGDLCHLPPQQMQQLVEEVNTLAADGKRVIGVARASTDQGNLPAGQHDFDFEFLGLLGLEDPIRPTVRQAVQECSSAGIRVIMITGDYPATAKNIAEQIGLNNPTECVTGSELEAMENDELKRRLGMTNIFARMVPEQKLRLVTVLKEMGEVVAMTGDGVNDAPALKAAHIGIAMGARGTDVAREASSIVLLDDDFGSIVAAVRMGRRIYDNLKKAMMYIFSVHIPIAGMSILPILFGWPFALFPVHIVFLELIIDPACTVVFEGEGDEKNIMSRPPRKLGESIFGVRGVFVGLVQGLGVLAVIAGLYSWALGAFSDPMTARAIGFTTMVVANIGLILTNRSWTRSIVAMLRVPNRALWWITAGAMSLILVTVYVPFISPLFQFRPIGILEMLYTLGAATVGILLSELLKTLPFRRLFSDRG
jgi:P-type Ca2+ transporter type 2C